MEFLKIAFEDSNKKFNEEQLKKYEKLKEKTSNCRGKKSIRTVYAAIGSEKVKLVKGVPVPESVFELIKGAGSVAYYFG